MQSELLTVPTSTLRFRCVKKDLTPDRLIVPFVKPARMTGYLIHLGRPWRGIAHLMLIASDITSMLEQFDGGPWCQDEYVRDYSRMVWTASTVPEWKDFHSHCLRSLCDVCTVRRSILLSKVRKQTLKAQESQ